MTEDEKQRLNGDGKALVRFVEEFARIHPEFYAALTQARDEMEAGQFVRFDYDGWHDDDR